MKIFPGTLQSKGLTFFNLLLRVDILTGLYAANAVQAALRHRDKTGEGQAIDISLLDSLVAALANQSQGFLATGQSPSRMGNAHPSIAPYDVFKTGDGHIVLAVGNDDQFEVLCLNQRKVPITTDVSDKDVAQRMGNH